MKRLILAALLLALFFEGNSLCFTADAQSESPVQPPVNTLPTLSNVTYTRLEKLPPGTLRSAFVKTGSSLINNLNVVAIENHTPILIRGGGFTEAGLDWLILKMGVRTIIDLRGRFDDDKSHQLIANTPEVIADHKRHGTLHKLENLSPSEVKQYLETLQASSHIPVQYIQIKAEDPKLMAYLDRASTSQPIAMFCQWGINRSGTAWGAYAAHKGWSFDRAVQEFSVSTPEGKIRNKRDIEYGFGLRP